MSEDLYDVIIIGGGPAGLSAAQYASRARLKTLVLDKSAAAGALSMAHMIENYPGLVNPLTGKELLDVFKKQAIEFGAEILEAQVIGVNLHGNVKEVFTMEKNYSGKSVIVATGSMGRRPSIKGEAEYLGRGVSYCAVCDAAFFKDKTVCVLGTAEEAVKEAGYLTKFCEKVYIISPAKHLKVEDDHPALEKTNLEVMLDYTALEIEGGDAVERIKLLGPDKQEISLEVSGVFVYIHGNRPIVDYLNEAVDLSLEECVVSNRLMETSIPGVFAAGDVTCTEIRQVVVAAANGAVAALSAEKFVTHRSRRRHDWSKAK